MLTKPNTNTVNSFREFNSQTTSFSDNQGNTRAYRCNKSHISFLSQLHPNTLGSVNMQNLYNYLKTTTLSPSHRRHLSGIMHHGSNLQKRFMIRSIEEGTSLRSVYVMAVVFPAALALYIKGLSIFAFLML